MLCLIFLSNPGCVEVSANKIKCFVFLYLFMVILFSFSQVLFLKMFCYFFFLSCSVQAIHQKAMFLMSQCQDYLQRAKMVLHGVSKVIAPISSVCLPFLWAEREDNPFGYTFITFLDDEAVSNIFLGFHFLKTQTISSAQYNIDRGLKRCVCAVFFL